MSRRFLDAGGARSPEKPRHANLVRRYFLARPWPHRGIAATPQLSALIPRPHPPPSPRPIESINPITRPMHAATSSINARALRITEDHAPALHIPVPFTSAADDSSFSGPGRPLVSKRRGSRKVAYARGRISPVQSMRAFPVLCGGSVGAFSRGASKQRGEKG